MSAHIVFIHRGFDQNLSYVLGQAKASNPHAIIHLIGDNDNRMFGNLADYHDCKDYFHSAEEFEKYFDHADIRHCPHKFLWYQRWFVLKDFLITRGIKNCFYADSDVMIYADIEKELKKFREFDFTLSDNPERVGLSGHSSFWNDIDSLKQFCRFLMRMFTKRNIKDYNKMAGYYELLHGKGLLGEINDMFALRMFRDYGTVYTGYTTRIIGRTTYDHNINESLNGDIYFEMREGMKKIDWENGVPYGAVINTGERIRFNTLHLQNGAKRYIRRFFESHKRDVSPGYALGRTYRDMR